MPKRPPKTGGADHGARRQPADVEPTAATTATTAEPGVPRSDDKEAVAAPPEMARIRRELDELREQVDMIMNTLPGLFHTLEEAGLIGTRRALENTVECHVQTHGGMTGPLVRFLGMMLLGSRRDKASFLDGFPGDDKRLRKAIERLLAPGPSAGV